MERKRIVGLIVAVMVVMMMMMVKGAESRLLKIGARGWIPNYNYTQWLNQQHNHFYVGDWLYFVFDKHYFNVLEVNKTSYENCNDQGFIFNVTRGGRDVYQVNEARTYYFLSSGGYCWNGMKITISVEEAVSPTPAPAPAAKNNSPTRTHFTFLSVSFYVALVWAIFLKP